MKILEHLKGKHIYFIGIGGISMSGLALLAFENGAIVSGSDLASNNETAKLKELGININKSHESKNIKNNIDLVVYTSAISCDNLEYLKARELGIPLVERGQFLGDISNCYEKVIAVAGTHGKTTTTAMIGEIMTHAGLKPTIHLGGESIGLKGNTIVGENKYFVVEACEYKESFRSLNSFIGVITNVELDHLDYYKDYNAIISAFNKFAGCSEFLICDEKTPILHDNVTTTNKDWKVKNVEFIGGGYNFNVFYKTEFYGTFRINMLGYHNVTNALCAIVVADKLGISKTDIERALTDFQGVERRYETIFRYDNACRVIIDYAHHPTEIYTSVDGLKSVYHKTLYVFQPHTYSRTKALFSDFISVLEPLDNLVIYATYPARESLIYGGTAMDLFSGLKNINKKYFDDIKSLRQFIDENSSKFDSVLVLGAGDLADKLKINYNNR